jgi:hypothetical protein
MSAYVDVMTRFRKVLKVLPTDLVLDFFDIPFLRDGVINGASNRLRVRFLELNSSCTCSSRILPVMLCLALAAQKVLITKV